MALTEGITTNLQDGEDDMSEWQQSIRARVTALKCHVMANKGLTPEGHIIKPYDPETLLQLPHNKCLLEGSDQQSINEYVAEALKNLKDNEGEPGEDRSNIDVAPEDVMLRLQESSTQNSPYISRSSSIIGSVESSPYHKSENSESFLKLNTQNGSQKSLSNCRSDSIESINNSSDSLKIQSLSDTSVDDTPNQLKSLKEDIKHKDEEINRLGKIRDQVENELQELTANLFQEAHSMVAEANQRAATADKGLKEANMQVDVLSAEVSALKTLVITSTPSEPNLHLHKQLMMKSVPVPESTGKKIFQRGHRKSPSDFDLKYGRDTTPPSSPLKESRLAGSPTSSSPIPLDPECWEVDPVVHREFVAWKNDPCLDQNNPFMKRVHEEDIDLCLAFSNSTLAHRVSNAIQENSIYIEEVNPRQKSSCPKTCVLLDVPRFCKYRFRLGEDDENWYYISQLARNRIIAVCDFLNYLRYIQLGLVKSSIHDVYWEVVKLRRQMVLARLGF